MECALPDVNQRPQFGQCNYDRQHELTMSVEAMGTDRPI
jgi:hypothetical protein